MKSKLKAKAGTQPQRGLSVDFKVGILHTIADAIYSTPAGKLREAVANARDNRASKVIIALDQANHCVCIFDNGTGITDKRFHEIFHSIGYGLLRNEPDGKLSYFGLGLMSIFQLGSDIKVYTRAKGEKTIRRLHVDAKAIFDPANENESISFLQKCISLETSNDAARASAVPLLVNGHLSDKGPDTTTDSFTQIVIGGVSDAVLATICSDDFVKELRQILPLRPASDEPFLKRFVGKKGQQIKTILENPDYCSTVEVLFGIQEDNSLEQLWKYFPSFKSDLLFPDDNVYVGTSAQKEFSYYIVHTVAVDLHRSKEDERESGFWIRNQNFLVKSSDFLERPGPGRKIKIIDEPLKGWIFGEIFHRNMNDFLAVSRNEYLFDRPNFKSFRDAITQIVEGLNQQLRDIWKRRKEIVDGLVLPFSQIETEEGAIHKAEQYLRRMKRPDVQEQQFCKEMFKLLDAARDKTIENDSSRIDLILASRKDLLTLGEDDSALVQIAPSLKGKVSDCAVTWDSDRKRVVVNISPDVFRSREVVFLGSTFKIFFVVQKSTDMGVSIDPGRKHIYINPFNKQLVHYSISVLDVYIALHIARAVSQDMDELVRNTLALLGAESSINAQFVVPLGDELRRSVKLSGSKA